jgi:hypothetical protein
MAELPRASTREEFGRFRKLYTDCPPTWAKLLNDCSRMIARITPCFMPAN